MTKFECETHTRTDYETVTVEAENAEEARGMIEDMMFDGILETCDWNRDGGRPETIIEVKEVEGKEKGKTN